MAQIRISPLVPLQPLLPLFHRLNREHFGGALTLEGQPLSSVRWSDGRMSRTAGYYKRGPGVGHGRGSEIVLSRPLLEPLPQEAIESTLCHEMIHAWVDLILQRRESIYERWGIAEVAVKMLTEAINLTRLIAADLRDNKI